MLRPRLKKHKVFQFMHACMFLRYYLSCMHACMHAFFEVYVSFTFCFSVSFLFVCYMHDACMTCVDDMRVMRDMREMRVMRDMRVC